ncbi:carboxymuconolactone decarboxylase family protein [Chryseobacterium populi]|uniref:carboxymuconolactone decarboxylase family protein n=1 Tax=Chryseobacterium populi TaxID=1144316 RepID=UPI001930D724|nr:carboxymuconolactone decarboxylase family protein [Chryseobacterium populi]
MLYKAHASIRQSGIDTGLIALAELKTSQLNGCAYCCSFHADELREMGIDQRLIDKIPGYRHSQSFTREQFAVLRWAETLTLLKEDTDLILADLMPLFDDKQIVDLTASISLMNALNRLRISLGDKD